MQTTLSPHVQQVSVSALVALAMITGTATAASPVTAVEDANDCFSGRTGSVGVIDHPTAAEDIVLQMSVAGGFVPFEVAFLEQNPVFTLYGNDAAIFRPSTSHQSISEPWPPYRCVHLSPEQVDELLRFALRDGGLAEADELYLHPFIADTPTTTFTIDAAGTDKVVSIQALGFDDAPDKEARVGFEALAELLSHFDDEVDGDEPYDVTVYEALLSPWWAETEAEAVTWPWSQPTIAEFEGDEFARYAMLTAEQAAKIVDVPNGGQILVPVTSPTGEVLSLSVRPILPGGVTAADT